MSSPGRRPLSRRYFLLGAAGVGAAVAFPGGRMMRAAAAVTSDPFRLGVASGDPLSDQVVIWTRLAVDPLSKTSPGGMGTGSVDVAWEVATDSGFGHVVRSGTVTAAASAGHSVHVDVTGLSAATQYFYRFHVVSGTTTYSTATGITKTAPAAGVIPTQLRFATASCAHYEDGYYHAYQAIADDHLDLVFFLGDYLYEGAPYTTPGSGTAPYKVRTYATLNEQGADASSPGVMDTLNEYRLRYAQEKSDPGLQAAHLNSAWVSVFDDHELSNNWYGQDTALDPIDRKAWAFQAWYENMPVRVAQKPNYADIQLYRRIPWGGLARFDMLDTRQFRDKQAGTRACSVIDSSSRTITGTTQEQWLLSGFADHSARWNFLGQQVFFSPFPSSSTACDVNTDAWDGYRPERDRIATGWVNAGVRNPVVLTGDVHRHFAANVCTTSNLSKSVGAELIATSISSTGHRTTDPVISSAAPDVVYGANWRGYIRCTLTPTRLTADFRKIDDVNIPDYRNVTVGTDATFVVEDGARKLTRA